METFLSSQINALLLKASWSEGLQRQSGLAMASQKWTENPGWFLWPADPDGAYSLSLDQTGEAAGGKAARGLFGIRFYPRPESGWFPLFSAEEQELVLGGLFDDTNTPVFEAQDKIPENLFLVGWMEMDLDLDQNWCLCSLSALESCLEYDRRELVRQVPGWKLSHRLYSTLLCLLANHGRMKPVFAHGLREDGFEMVRQKEGSLKDRKSPAFLYGLSVLMVRPPLGPPPRALKLLADDHERTEAAPIFQSVFSCGHLHGPGPEICGEKALNPKWWSLAGEEFTSHLCSTCGCEH